MSDYQALYRFYNSDDELLYIGITLNPSERFKQHKGEKPWWTEVARIEIQTYESRQAVTDAEQAAIRSERPKYNVVHNNVFATKSRSKNSSFLRRLSQQCKTCRRRVSPWAYMPVSDSRSRCFFYCTTCLDTFTIDIDTSSELIDEYKQLTSYLAVQFSCPYHFMASPTNISGSAPYLCPECSALWIGPKRHEWWYSDETLEVKDRSRVIAPKQKGFMELPLPGAPIGTAAVILTKEDEWSVHFGILEGRDGDRVFLRGKDYFTGQYDLPIYFIKSESIVKYQTAKPSRTNTFWDQDLVVTANEWLRTYYGAGSEGGAA